MILYPYYKIPNQCKTYNNKTMIMYYLMVKIKLEYFRGSDIIIKIYKKILILYSLILLGYISYFIYSNVFYNGSAVEHYNDNIINTKVNGKNNEKNNIKKNNPINFFSIKNKENVIDNNKKEIINFLVLGVEKDPRTDSIFFVSFNTIIPKIDIISIPRDTYFYEDGYDLPGQRKINAKYGRGIKYGKDSAAKKTMEAIESILGAPIDYYIIVSYKSVEEIIDTVGGVEVDVPFTMKYTDYNDKPPLKIYIPKGKQILDGKKAIKYLRWRKNDNGRGYKNGDIGRINTQLNFVKKVIKESFGPKLPIIVKKCFSAIDTNLSKIEALKLSIIAMKIKTENVFTYILPGDSKLVKINGRKVSYYYYDKIKTKELIKVLFKKSF